MKHAIGMITLLPICLLLGCQAAAAQPAGSPRNVVRVGDFQLEMLWCEVTPDRKAACEVRITSLYQDLRAGLSYPKMQDDRGAETRLMTDQPVGGAVLVAGQPYLYRLTASNLPNYVTKVRSINSGFASWAANNSKMPGHNVVFTDIPPRPVPGQTASPAVEASLSKTPPPEWEIIGYWNYDGVDGQQLPDGLVLIEATGSGLGQTWQHQLELKTHAQLPERSRSLWPVRLNRQLKKICADYPGYPSYAAHVDMPDEAFDGVYSIGPCPISN